MNEHTDTNQIDKTPKRFTTASNRVAFVGRQAAVVPAPAKTMSATAQHRSGCTCASCSSFSLTRLFADVVAEAEDVPEEVAALDGVESEDEAHNVDRPARQQLRKKKGNQGKALSEFEVGSTVKGTVKSITSYGAFIDIGATTDGLLHVSQLSTGFVNDVSEVLSEKQEVEVRIIKIDEKKNQVGLSLMTAAEEEASNEAQEARQNNRQSNRRQQQQNNRRDDSAILDALVEKGWDSSAMVEGTVVSTVDFGCFVRIDASALNPECEGEFDGLVHVSAMSKDRVGRVTDVVSLDDKIQVRVNSIEGGKVSLTMLSVEDEAAKAEASGPSGGGDAPAVIEGAKDWKQILVTMEEEMPAFTNTIVIEAARK